MHVWKRGVSNSPPFSNILALIGLFPHELMFSIKPLFLSQLFKRRKNTCPPPPWPCSGLACITRLAQTVSPQNPGARNQTHCKAKEEVPPVESIKSTGQNLQQRPPVHPCQTCSLSSPASSLYPILAPGHRELAQHCVY